MHFRTFFLALVAAALTAALPTSQSSSPAEPSRDHNDDETTKVFVYFSPSPPVLPPPPVCLSEKAVACDHIHKYLTDMREEVLHSHQWAIDLLDGLPRGARWPKEWSRDPLENPAKSTNQHHHYPDPAKSTNQPHHYPDPPRKMRPAAFFALAITAIVPATAAPLSIGGDGYCMPVCDDEGLSPGSCGPCLGPRDRRLPVEPEPTTTIVPAAVPTRPTPPPSHQRRHPGMAGVKTVIGFKIATNRFG
ncbi:hypothetical protein PG993_009181 [Apiospora rasikravindrae]|uniref:Uncharacterized protein n=1 Tax=Apiospora rasikravindrae TaxID=990691 RepID=A0ABR1SIM6_9PEZI